MKIVALVPFPFVGMEFGGSERIYNLLTRVQAPLEVLVPHLKTPQRMIHKNLSVTALPIPEHVRHLEWDLQVVKSSKKLFGSIIDELNPDLVILEHPWQIDGVGNRPFIYDAHNNETKLKKLLAGKEMIKATEVVEKAALKAKHVTTCSKDDDLKTKSPLTLIPNGVNLPERKNTVGSRSNVLLFVGSAHPPNIGAAMSLAGLATALPNYQIVIVGKCGAYLSEVPSNVQILGHVDAATLEQLFLHSHAFLNLMGAGSGTSLKVIKAISYGLPVISSAIGARGYEQGCIVAKSAQEVLETLERLKCPDFYQMASERNLELAKGYSWDVIGERFNEVVYSAA